MAALQEAGQGELIEWVKEVSLCIARKHPLRPSGRLIGAPIVKPKII